VVWKRQDTGVCVACYSGNRSWVAGHFVDKPPGRVPPADLLLLGRVYSIFCRPDSALPRVTAGSLAGCGVGV
jgi:hypothetical protein